MQDTVRNTVHLTWAAVWWTELSIVWKHPGKTKSVCAFGRPWVIGAPYNRINRSSIINRSSSAIIINRNRNRPSSKRGRTETDRTIIDDRPSNNNKNNRCAMRWWCDDDWFKQRGVCVVPSYGTITIGQQARCPNLNLTQHNQARHNTVLFCPG